MKKITKKIFASVLALAMTVAGTTVAFAEEAAMPAPSASAAIVDNNAVITVTADGDFVNGFDYGIVYDATKVKVSGIKVDDAFKAFLENGQGINTTNNFKDKGYVVVGGVVTNMNNLGDEVPTTYAGTVATVTFVALEGATLTDAEFAVVADSANTFKDVDSAISNLPAGTVTTKPEVPATEAPATDAPATEAPATDAPAEPTKAPVDPTKAPADPTKAPVAPTATVAPTKAPAPTSPKTGDAGVILPIVAICGAAAAVAVASKKRVED